MAIVAETKVMRLAALLLLLAACRASLPEVTETDLISAGTSVTTLLTDKPFSLTLRFSWPPANYAENVSVYYKVTLQGTGQLLATGEEPVVDDTPALVGEITIPGLVVSSSGTQTLEVQLSSNEQFVSEVTDVDVEIWVILGPLTVIPPVITIFLTIVTSDVILSLFCGVWTAAILIYQFNVGVALLRVLDTFLVDSLADTGHAQIILFSWFLAGMVAVLYKAGGGHGFAAVVSRLAKTRRSTQFVILLVTLLMFFDDYANSLLSGMTMRPVADNMLLSREKLAFLVDSAAAPIASTAPISAWIGFELGLIEESFNTLIAEGNDLAAMGYETNPYLVFLQTIPSRYYPLFVLMFQIALVVFGREAGPMLTAERRARYEGKLVSDTANLAETGLDNSQEPEDDCPRAWWNAIIPILGVVGGVIGGLIGTGVQSASDQGLPLNATNIFGNADSYLALLWATFFGSVLTGVLVLLQWKRDGKVVLPFTKGGKALMTYGQIMEHWFKGIMHLTMAVMTLIFAWSIGAAISACGTGVYVSDVLSGSLPKEVLPVLVFLISAVIAFATGTSWGTMSIIFPIAVPTAFKIAPGNSDIMSLTISAILAGSVFGDHCTFISDTTILSALSTKCDLRHHVKTQIPYAVTCCLVAALIGYLPAGYLYATLDDWVFLLTGLVIIFIGVFVLCAPVIDPKQSPDAVTRVLMLLGMKGPPRYDTPPLDPMEAAQMRLVEDAVMQELKDVDGLMHASGELDGGVRVDSAPRVNRRSQLLLNGVNEPGLPAMPRAHQ